MADDGFFPQKTYVEVAVHEPVFQLYTYSLPEEMEHLPVGGVVEIPLGRRKTRGCIVSRFHTLPPELAKVRIRNISGEVTPGFTIAEDILKLALWIARYYMAPPGDCCSCVSFIGFNDIAAQTIKRYLITTSGQQAVEGHHPVKLGSKQRPALEFLARQHGGLATINDIHDATGASLSSIKSLVAHGWTEEFVQEVTRSDDYAKFSGSEDELAFSAEQELAFGEISRSMDASESETFLLHGVTGSGKTEIYLQAIRKALADGGEAVVLVPEISLTPQTVDRFRRRFGDVVGVYHSRLTLGQKFDLWRDVVSGHIKIIVGARSALFTPFKNLRVIVVDEEHEITYKQDSSPRYHARDIAIKRAHDTDAVCILGSATPSIESYYKALSGKFKLLTLAERIDGKPMPPVTVVDMAQEVKDEGNPEFISRQMADGMAQCLSRKEQVLLFLNRRGFFNFVICLQCQEAVK